MKAKSVVTRSSILRSMFPNPWSITSTLNMLRQLNKSAKTFVDHDKTKKALKKAKEEVSRLTNKTNEYLKTISNLRETTIPKADYNKIL